MLDPQQRTARDHNFFSKAPMSHRWYHDNSFTFTAFVLPWPSTLSQDGLRSGSSLSPEKMAGYVTCFLSTRSALLCIGWTSRKGRKYMLSHLWYESKHTLFSPAYPPPNTPCSSFSLSVLIPIAGRKPVTLLRIQPNGQCCRGAGLQLSSRPSVAYIGNPSAPTPTLPSRIAVVLLVFNRALYPEILFISWASPVVV